MKCKICKKEFEPTHGNQRCCSDKCKYENKIKINKKIIKKIDDMSMFENYDRETYIEWLVEHKDYSLKTANEKYNEIRQAYMRGNNKEVLSI